MMSQKELQEWHWYDPVFLSTMLFLALVELFAGSWPMGGMWLTSVLLIAFFLAATKEGQLGSLVRQLRHSLTGRVFYTALSVTIFVLIAIQASMWL